MATDERQKKVHDSLQTHSGFSEYGILESQSVSHTRLKESTHLYYSHKRMLKFHLQKKGASFKKCATFYLVPRAQRHVAQSFSKHP